LISWRSSTRFYAIVPRAQVPLGELVRGPCAHPDEVVPPFSLNHALVRRFVTPDNRVKRNLVSAVRACMCAGLRAGACAGAGACLWID
jgi:hypothetical protein